MQELESRNSLWSLVLRVHLVLEEFKVSLIKSEALGSLEGSGADRASSATRELQGFVESTAKPFMTAKLLAALPMTESEQKRLRAENEEGRKGRGGVIGVVSLDCKIQDGFYSGSRLESGS